MRKSRNIISLSVLASVVLLAANTHAKSENAVVRLLNSRSSGSLTTYASAAEEVAEGAHNGNKLYGFVLALISREPNAPEAARIDEGTRKKYLDACRPLLEKNANEKNNAMAWYLLSLESGNTNLLRRAAESKNIQAQNAWGTFLVGQAASPNMTSNEVSTVLSEAFGLFKEVADKDDANGLYNTGMCYWRGLGVNQDKERAFTYFRNAAAQGHPEAINNIGAFFREGMVVEKNLETSAKWFAKSASYGNPYGQFNYALALRRGEGVEVNLPEAARLFRLSAAGGCVEALDAYACALWRGEGVAKDPKLAFKLFERAANAGFPPAMENMSACYDKGVGVKADKEKSLEWKIRSRAARGDRNAQLWLQQRKEK